METSAPSTELWEGASPAPGHLIGPMPRMAVACGAFGAYDRERVLTTAALLTPEMRVVHEGDGAIVLLDRKPRRWGEKDSGEHGLAWPGSLAPASAARDWSDAARAWNSAGVAFEGGRATLHTSISGLSPLYLQREDEASYFATCADPLVRTSPGLLTVDWESWASTLTLGFPIGGRSQFREITYMGPWSTATHAPRGPSRLESHTWPWAEIEPTLSAKEGAGAVAEALRDVFSRLEGAELISPISSGRDSRLLGWLARNCGATSTQAFTVYEDTGTRAATEMAATAAAALGLPHTVIDPLPEHFWEDSRRHALTSDFQFPNAPWLGTPLSRAIGGIPGITVDGYAGNALFEPTARSVLPQVITDPGPKWRALLWQKMRTRALRAAFRQEEASAIGNLARDQFLAHCDPLTDHPSRAALAFYLSRTVRGIAIRPVATLGRVCDVVCPLADPTVAEALLSVRAEEKFDKKLYEAVFEALDPGLAAQPFSSAGAGATFDEVPRRRVSEPALRGYREIVGAGPMRGQLSGRVRGWLRGEDAMPPGGRQTMNGLEKPVTFHLWHQRYREHLRPFSVAEGFGTPERRAGGARGGRR